MQSPAMLTNCWTKELRKALICPDWSNKGLRRASLEQRIRLPLSGAETEESCEESCGHAVALSTGMNHFQKLPQHLEPSIWESPLGRWPS